MKRSFKLGTLKLAAISVGALAAGGFGGHAYAAQSTGTFAVSATVAASCTVSGTSLAFGSFDALGANVDSTSTLTATCTNGSAYTIGLNEGTTAAGTTTVRKMVHTDGINTLDYTLSAISSGGANWGGVGEAGVAAGTGNGAGQSITVFGRIPTGQSSAITGAYSDTITATIDF